MSNNDNIKLLGVKVEKDVFNAFQELASSTTCTKSYLMTKAIALLLKDEGKPVPAQIRERAARPTDGRGKRVRQVQHAAGD